MTSPTESSVSIELPNPSIRVSHVVNAFLQLWVRAAALNDETPRSRVSCSAGVR